MKLVVGEFRFFRLTGQNVGFTVSWGYSISAGITHDNGVDK